MPTAGNVDERIVEMRIDHEKFEKGAKKTIDILERLDEGLKSLGTKQTDGFDNITSSLDKVTNKISIFGTMGDQIIRNLTTQAMNLAHEFLHMADSLSIDQIAVGWGKYAEKTQGVQTIMAATAKDWEDQGAQMEYVNAQLTKLNWFTDETSYNLLDMVNNIGKFTSNGVDLETAVTAMQGISTWAAISGGTINEAGRAMYNMSQALATGSVKLIDWKSIENANMATREFKETALETALALGTLTKSGNKWVTLTGKEFTTEQFNTELSQGWFTSDVLLKTLDQYGSFTNLLYEVSDATDMTATEILEEIEAYEKNGRTIEALLPYIKQLTSAEYDVGRRAFKAAQEAKTFKEAIDATKDAVSTGWMNIFETMFGNYLKAKDLWTDVAESLYNIFAEPVNRLNEIFDQAFNNPNPLKEYLGGAGFTLGDLESAAASLSDYVVGFSEDLYKNITLDNLIKDYGSLEEVIKAGVLSASDLKVILDQMNKNRTNDIINGKNDTFNSEIEKIQQYAKYLKEGKVGREAIESAGIDYYMVKWWSDKWKEQEEYYKKNPNKGGGYSGKDPFLVEFMNEYKDNLLELAGYTEEQIAYFNELGLSVDEILASMRTPEVIRAEGFKLFTESLMNLLHVVENVASAVNNAISIIFGGTGKEKEEIANSILAERIYNLIARFNAFTEGLKNATANADELAQRFLGVVSVVGAINWVVGKAIGLFRFIIRIVFQIIDAIGRSNILQYLGTGLLLILQALIIPLQIIFDYFGKLLNRGKELGKQWWAKYLEQHFAALGVRIQAAAEKFKQFTESSKVAQWLTSVLDKLVSFATKLGLKFSDLIKKVRNYGKLFKREFSINGISGVLKLLGRLIYDRFSKIFSNLKKLFKVKGIKGVFQELITNIVAFFSDNVNYETIKKSVEDFFSNIFGKIGTFLFGKVNFSKITEAWNSVKEFFSGLFSNFNFSFLSEGFKKLKTFLSGKINFRNIIDTIKTFISGLGEIVDVAAPYIKTGLIIFTLLHIWRWSKTIQWTIESVSEFAEGMKFGALAAMFVGLGLFIVALAGALKLLSTIKEDDMVVAINGLLSAGLVLSAVVGLIGYVGDKLFVATNKVVKIGKKISLNMKSVKSVLWSIVPVAIAIGIVAASLFFLGKMDFAELIKGFAALSLLLTEIAAFVVICGVASKFANANMSGILYMAIGIWIIADALKRLGQLKVSEMLKGWIGLKIIMSQIMKFMKTTAYMARGAMTYDGLLYMAMAVWLIADKLKALGQLKISEIFKGWIALKLIIGQIIRFTKKSSGASKVMYKTGDDWFRASKSFGGLIALAVSVAILAGVLKRVGSLDVATLLKGLIGVLILIGSLTKVLRKTVVGGGLFGLGKNKASVNGKQLWGLIGLALSVAVIAEVVTRLGKYPVGQLAKGIIAISFIFQSLGKLLKSMRGTFKQNAIKNILSALMIIGIIAASAMAIKSLSKIPAKALAAATGALSAMIIAIAGSLTVLNKFGGGFNAGTIGMLLAGIGAVWLIANVILVPLAETNVNWDEIAKIALIMIGSLVAIAGAMFIIGKIPAGGAVKGVAGIGLILAAIEVVIGALIGIGLAVLGLAIGMAQKLSEFTTALEPFLEDIKSYDDSTVASLDRFAEMMGKLAVAQLWTTVASILSLLGDGLSVAMKMSLFTTFLAPFIEHIKTYDDTTLANVQRFADMMAAIAEATFWDTLAGLFAKIPGADFMTKLIAFVKRMPLFLRDLKRIPQGAEDDVARLTTVMQALTEVTIWEAIGELVGKIAEWIPGDSKDMFDRLSDLASGLSGEDGFLSKLDSITGKETLQVARFSSIMKSLVAVNAWDVINQMISALGNLGEAGDNYPERLAKLPENIMAFVDAFKDKEFPKDAEDKIGRFGSIMEAITKITAWDALNGVISAIGQKYGTDYIDNLKTLPEGVRGLCDALKKWNIGDGTEKKVERFANIMNAIGTITSWDFLASMLSTLKNKLNFGSFADNLKDLPGQVSGFANALDSESFPDGIDKKVKSFSELMKDLLGITGWATLSDIIAHISPANKGDKNAMELLRDFTAALPDFITNISSLDGTESSKIETFTDCILAITNAKLWSTNWATFNADEAEKAGELIDVLDTFNTKFIPFFQHFTTELTTDDVNKVATAFDILDSIGKNKILTNLTEEVQSFWMNLQVGALDDSKVDLDMTARLLSSTAELITGIVSLKDLLSESGSSFDSDLLAGLVQSIIKVGNATEFSSNAINIGHKIITKIIEGLKEYKQNLSDDIGVNVAGAISVAGNDAMIAKSAWNIGHNIAIGVAQGMYDGAPSIQIAAQYLANLASGAIASTLEINSPSRVFARLGAFLPAGLAQGIEENSSIAEGSITILGSAILAAMQQAMLAVATVADESFEFSPTITPVVDMSNVQFAAGSAGRMFGTIGSAIRGSVAIADERAQSTAANYHRDSGNDGVITEIRSLSDRVGDLGEAVRNMQIVLDTGTLVGATSSKMDAALGTAQVRKGRGN